MADELITDICRTSTTSIPCVENTFRSSPTGYLRSSRQIVEGTDLEALLHWITPDILARTDTSILDRFRMHLVSAIRRRPESLLNHHKDRISKLPIFKKLEPYNHAEPYRFDPQSEF